MSEHMRTRPTNSRSDEHSVLYIQHDHKTYAIPKKIADKYLISSDEESGSVSAESIFLELEGKFTKAGSLLKGLRTREGLTQVEFSKKLGVTQANLSNMENGRRPIGKTVAKRIEKVFKVNYRYFIE